MHLKTLTAALLALPTLTLANPLPKPEPAGLEIRDECTSNRDEWTTHCNDGAMACCMKGEGKLDWLQNTCYHALQSFEYYCQNHFDGNNCAHAYNQGARYEEANYPGFKCGI